MGFPIRSPTSLHAMPFSVRNLAVPAEPVSAQPRSWRALARVRSGSSLVYEARCAVFMREYYHRALLHCLLREIHRDLIESVCIVRLLADGGLARNAGEEDRDGRPAAERAANRDAALVHLYEL